MIKKLLLHTTLISIAFCDTLILDDISGINIRDIENQDIVTYSKKSNKLEKSYYYLKDDQLYKKIDGTVTPTNDLKGKESRRFQYKTKLNNIGCVSLKAKECIENSIIENKYFKNEKEKIYLLKKEIFPIYKIIKHNY